MKLMVRCPFYFINNNWMGCTLSEENNTGDALVHIKRDQILHVASLNYCGILKNPFQFYSGHFLSELRTLSSLFNRLRDKYISPSANQTFSWKFGKLDKKIKQKRFSPLYNPMTGIVDNKFIGKAKFTSMWNTKFDIALKEENVQFPALEREEALNFDLLAYHTFLNYVYGAESIDQMEGKSAQQYMKKIGPFFQQAFLSEQKKIQKFINGLQNTFSDVIFLQEPSQDLIQMLTQKKDYFIELSPDKNTLVCVQRQKFKQFVSRDQLFSSLSKEEIALLDWNGHSAIMAADKYILISGHLSAKDNVNSDNVRDLKAGVELLKNKMPAYEVIIGADINSFLGDFNDEVTVFPNKSQRYTSLKMRTSMQTQTKKAQKMIKESKDSIVTTLDMIDGEVSTIGLNQPNDNYFLPQNDHPFDHFLVFAKLNMKKNRQEIK